jgi:hypothetical protein
MLANTASEDDSGSGDDRAVDEADEPCHDHKIEGGVGAERQQERQRRYRDRASDAGGGEPMPPNTRPTRPRTRVIVGDHRERCEQE